MIIKRARYFALHELLPPDIYHHLRKRGQLWKGWILVPPSTIATIDALRAEFGPMFINTYRLGRAVQMKYGYRDQSGMRIMDLSDRPGYISAHFNLLGTDSLFRDYSAEEVRKIILEDPDKFPHINRLECTIDGEQIGWLHWDSMSVQDRIVQLHLKTS